MTRLHQQQTNMNTMAFLHQTIVPLLILHQMDPSVPTRNHRRNIKVQCLIHHPAGITALYHNDIAENEWDILTN